MSKTILAIDTATEACSVALLHNDKTTHIFEVCPQQHSQKILGFVERILSDADLTTTDLHAIAYGCGPGSFTGVRIAASTVQGLAFANDIPVISVSTLATMAYENFVEYEQSESLAMIDARMSEVYFAHYKCRLDGVVENLSVESVLSPDKLPLDVRCFQIEQLVGTGVVAYQQELLIKNLPSNPDVLYPNAKYMLPLAQNALAVGSYGTAKDVSPSYVRDRVTWKKLPGR